MSVKKAAIAGSTGLIGSKLRDLLSSENLVEELIVFARKEISVHANERLLQVDLANLEDVTDIDDLDVGYCALGTTIRKAGSQDQFRKVDVGMVESFARWCKQKGASTFVVISSMGANADSSNFYLRTKGEMERIISDIGFDRLIILRPSLLLGDRGEFRFGEKLAQWVAMTMPFVFVGKLKEYKPVFDTQVARAILDKISNLPNGTYVISSDEIASFPNL